MTLYDELGIGPDATADEIKAAHRRAVKQAHPDTGGDRSRFDRVQHAFSVLSDQSRRARYDETGVDSDVSPESLLRAQAMTTVAGVLNALISNPQLDPARFDLVAGIRERLENELRELEGQAAQSRMMQTRFRTFSARLKRKAEVKGPDRVTPTIAVQIEALSARIVAIEEQMKMLAYAKAIAEEYVYEVDPAPQMVTMGSPYGAYQRSGFFGSAAT